MSEKRTSQEKKTRRVVLTASAIGASGIAASMIALHIARRHKRDGDKVVFVADTDLELDETDRDIEIAQSDERVLPGADIVYAGPDDILAEIGEDHAEVHGINIDPNTRRGRALLQLIERFRGSNYRAR